MCRIFRFRISYYDREQDQWLVRNFVFDNIVRSDNIVVKLKYSIDMLHLEVSDYGIDNLEDEINGRIFQTLNIVYYERGTIQ